MKKMKRNLQGLKIFWAFMTTGAAPLPALRKPKKTNQRQIRQMTWQESLNEIQAL